MDYLALSGLSGPQFAAVLGHSAQAMSAFTTLHALIKGVLNETAPADVAAGVVQAVYDRVKGAAASDAAQVRGCAQSLRPQGLLAAACNDGLLIVTGWQLACTLRATTPGVPIGSWLSTPRGAHPVSACNFTKDVRCLLCCWFICTGPDRPNTPQGCC